MKTLNDNPYNTGTHQRLSVTYFNRRRLNPDTSNPVSLQLGMESEDKYKLDSSANVVSLRKVLLEKDLLSKYRGEIRLSDPVLGMWMRK